MRYQKIISLLDNETKRWNKDWSKRWCTWSVWHHNLRLNLRLKF